VFKVRIRLLTQSSSSAEKKKKQATSIEKASLLLAPACSKSTQLHQRRTGLFPFVRRRRRHHYFFGLGRKNYYGV